MTNRRRAILVVATVLAAVVSENLSSQNPPSTPEGLGLLHKIQDALGGAKRLAAVRDFEETILAQAWDARGTPLGDVRKRTRWMKSPNLVRLDQRGPRGTYVLYFDGGSNSGWEILPDLTGDIRVNAGLQAQDLGAKPADYAPDIPAADGPSARTFPIC